MLSLSTCFSLSVQTSMTASTQGKGFGSQSTITSWFVLFMLCLCHDFITFAPEKTVLTSDKSDIGSDGRLSANRAWVPGGAALTWPGLAGIVTVAAPRPLLHRGTPPPLACGELPNCCGSPSRHTLYYGVLHTATSSTICYGVRSTRA